MLAPVNRNNPAGRGNLPPSQFGINHAEVKSVFKNFYCEEDAYFKFWRKACIDFGKLTTL